MYDLKHDLIDAQIQLESMKTENDLLKEQIKRLEEAAAKIKK